MKQPLTLFFAFLSLYSFAQAPQGFNYQGVARDANGAPYDSVHINVEISILDGSVNGTPVYSEAHSTLTNRFGLFNLIIGRGDSINGDFSNVDWGNAPKFLKVEIDNQFMGVTQLWSVPYALYAQNSSEWIKSTNGIYRVDGGVGIGALPVSSTKLSVVGHHSGAPFANGNILSVSHSNSGGALVFGQLDPNQWFIQSAKPGGPGTLALNPEGGIVCVPVLKVNGNDIIEKTNATEILIPGEVIVIDPEEPNHAKRSTKAYDQLALGVVSGAGDVQHGMELSQEGLLEGNTAFAIAGRVYVKIIGAVKPGDLLTTSDSPGRAMAAKNRRKREGAVIGKALSSPNEEGLVLMLVQSR